MDAAIKIGEFKKLVQQFRLLTKTDVTAFALNFSYSELQAGRKTPLVQRIELMQQRKPLPDTNIQAASVRKEKPNPERAMVNFKDPSILERILVPEKSLKRKSETFRRADLLGKNYAFVKCKIHGISLYRVTYSYIEKLGERVKKYTGYCLYCRINSQKQAPERIDHIRELSKKLMASQKAS